MEQTGQQVPHQQLFFNQTKLIFYFGDQSNTAKKERKKNRKDTHYSTNEDGLSEIADKNKENKHVPRNAHTSQGDRCARHNRAYQTDHVKLTLSRVHNSLDEKNFASTSSRKFNLSRDQRNAVSQQKQRKNQAKSVSVEEPKGEKIQKLSFSQIGTLFGSIHPYYSKSDHLSLCIDYDTVTKNKDSNFSPKKKISVTEKKQVNLSPKTQLNNSSTRTTVEKPPQIQLPNRKSFIFTKQTAPIADYIFNPKLRQKYDFLTNTPTKSPYQDKEFPPTPLPKYLHTPPDPLLPIFPCTPSPCPSNPHRIPLVHYLKFLFALTPEFFIRLMEPPMHNVFAVWLCVDEGFEPVVVDGYFPTFSGVDVFQEDCQYFWMKIFVKAICKLCKTYSVEALSAITFKQLYYLLNGFPLKATSVSKIESEAKLIGYYRKKKNQGKIILYEKQGQISRLTFDSRSQAFNIDHMDNRQKQSFSLRSHNGTLYTIEGAINWHMYYFQVNPQTLFKFQLTCHSSTDLCISLGSQSGEYARMCVYQPAYAGNNASGKHLLLYELDNKSQKTVSLRAGKYKLFYEDSTSIKQAMQGAKQCQKSNRMYNLIIKTSIGVTLGQAQKLQANDGQLQDTQNFYNIS